MLDQLIKYCSGGYFRNQPEHRTARDRPQDNLLIWVLSGRGFGTTEGEHHEATTGHLLTFRKGHWHDYGADPTDPWEILWFHFDGKLAGSFVDRIRGYGGTRVDLGLDPLIRDRFTELHVIAGGAGPAQRIRTQTALLALLGLIVQRLEQRREGAADHANLQIERVQAFIHDRLDQTITLADLAHEANLSTPHFSRLFRRLTRTSPMHYVIQQRIARATLLLSETAMPVQQIAAAVGYDDPYYFSRLFNKTTGVSPTQYRHQHRTR